ncbi:hypothetical protein ACTGU6_11260, partial [Streptococcus suis]
MTKVLLTHSYFLAFDAKQKKAAQPYPPLATIYAAALLREKDFEVKLWDSMFRKSAEEVLTAIKEFTPDFFVVYDD